MGCFRNLATIDNAFISFWKVYFPLAIEGKLRHSEGKKSIKLLHQVLNLSFYSLLADYSSMLSSIHYELERQVRAVFLNLKKKERERKKKRKRRKQQKDMFLFTNINILYSLYYI